MVGWCTTSEELSVSLLPETTDLGEALTGQQYAIVIIHVNPGDSAAVEILRQVRTQQSLIPVIVLTDTLDRNLALQALSTGADYYLWDITRENYPDLLIPVIKKLVQHYKV